VRLTKKIPSYWLKNIPHYSATKKTFTNPHTKQSTIKTVLKTAVVWENTSHFSL
jgi:hypothetical protein